MPASPRTRRVNKRTGTGSRMVISVDAWKLAYTAVPKAGCSSVKAMLAEIDPTVTLPEPESRSNKVYHQIYPTRRFRQKLFDRHQDGYRFTVVRDPIRRLMSVYTNRVVGLGDLHKSRMLTRRQVLPLDPDPDTFFQNLRRYMRMSSIIRHHSLPASLFAGPDLSIYDRVYRTDQMGELAEFLITRSGHALTVARANSSESRLDFDDLASQTRDALRPFLETEYSYLAGHIENRLA